jgi:predicted acetyltransferase
MESANAPNLKFLTMAEAHYRPVCEADLEAFASMASVSFSFDAKEAPKWFEKAGHENMRVLDKSGQIVAGLIRVPMGLWIAGNSISTVGVSGVATPPESRNQGHCKEMMKQFLIEEKSQGSPLSSLYAATFHLYRSVGYEHAGAWRKVEVPLQLLPRTSLPDGLELREGSPDDLPAIKSCYEKRARASNGMLDRGDYIWKKMMDPHQAKPRVWVFESSKEVEAYVVLSAKRKSDLDVDYTLHDIQSSTPRGYQALVGFVRSFYSMGGQAIWHSGPDDPILPLLPERGFQVELEDEWMIRILDVRAALEQRGWPKGRSGELHLQIKDPLFEDNNGSFILNVENGQAKVEQGGQGDLELSINSLAPLYTAHRSAESIALSSQAKGTAETLALATALFAAPAPGMPDMF